MPSDETLLISLAIFLARVLDVSIGTVRTILIIRGYRISGSLLGFVEILVWVAAAAKVIQNLESWYFAVAYAGGFATGNYVGSWLEARLALGSELVRAISRNPEVDLESRLHEAGFPVVELAGRASDGVAVEVLLLVESRRRIPHLLRVIRDADPDAVCTITDARHPAAAASEAMRRRPFARGGWRNALKRK